MDLILHFVPIVPKVRLNGTLVALLYTCASGVSHVDSASDV